MCSSPYKLVVKVACFCLLSGQTSSSIDPLWPIHYTSWTAEHSIDRSLDHLRLCQSPRPIWLFLLLRLLDNTVANLSVLSSLLLDGLWKVSCLSLFEIQLNLQPNRHSVSWIGPVLYDFSRYLVWSHPLRCSFSIFLLTYWLWSRTWFFLFVLFPF
jgi:hypothetical protein